MFETRLIGWVKTHDHPD